MIFPLKKWSFSESLLYCVVAVSVVVLVSYKFVVVSDYLTYISMSRKTLSLSLSLSIKKSSLPLLLLFLAA